MSASPGTWPGTGSLKRARVSSFAVERAVVAVGHAFGVEAQHLVAVGDDIDPVAFHAGRGADAQFHIVEIGAAPAGYQFGNHQSPEQFAGGFVEAEQHAAAGGLVARVVEIDVVRADKDFPARDDRAGVIFGAQPGDPLDVLRGLHVDARAVGEFFAGHERGGQVFFLGDHVARVVAAELGPVLGKGRRQRDCKKEKKKIANCKLQIANCKLPQKAAIPAVRMKAACYAENNRC